MINYIQLENFKSIKRLSLPVENLNLFFGMNGMGKSSVIQAGEYKTDRSRGRKKKGSRSRMSWARCTWFWGMVSTWIPSI